MNNLHQKFEIKSVSEEGTFIAYGNVFNVLDHNNDITISGAFTRSIQEHKDNGTMPKFLAQHGHTSMPIGIITDMYEDDIGLVFEGKFALGTQAGREAYELAKMRAIDEFSIGFITVDSVKKISNGKQIRELLELSVKEISLVTFACNPNSKIIEIKEALNNGENVTERMVQKVLQEYGMSKRQSETVINQIKSSNTELESKEFDVKSTDEKLEQKEQTIAVQPVPELKSKNKDLETKADWWMRDKLSEPILSIDCLMNVFYFLPPSTIAEMIVLAEKGRIEQNKILNPETVVEEKASKELESTDEEDEEETDKEKESTDEEDVEKEKEKETEKKSTKISIEEIQSWFNEDK